MTVGITFSTFDLLHAGHIKMLEFAKTQCDYLIVGLQTDPTIDRPDTKNAPVQSLVERWIQLDACKWVDKIIPYQTEKDILDILKSFTPDVRILGQEYGLKEFTGRDFCEEHGIELIFNPRLHDWSTTVLRQKIIDAKK
jgi:glycerol-3-phosphate cytidylyltransferase